MRAARPVTGRVMIVVALVGLILMAGVALAHRSEGLASGGPVALLGIDAEDGGPGAHGPVSAYVALVNGVLASRPTSAGSGILVIGGGKFPKVPDDVTAFWRAIGSAIPSTTITFVNGADAIKNKSFQGFAMIAVSSSVFQTPSGGLQVAEDDALNARSADVATFVNAGGALLGLSQSGFAVPFFYLGGIGGFTSNNNLSFSVINPTQEGQSLGITSALDVCCWKDEFPTFPAFLHILATNADTNNAVALGGSRIIVSPPVTPATTTTTSTSTTAPTSTTSTTVELNVQTPTTSTTSTTLPQAPTPIAITVPRIKATG